MILHAFYNKKAAGDVLLIRLGRGNTELFEKRDDLIILKDYEKIIGYNLLNASKYFKDLNTGLVKIDAAFVDKLNDVLKEKNLEPVFSDYQPQFLVGHIIDIQKHPNSDHLHICQVDLGREVVQIVCGANNVESDQYVVVARVGAVMPNGLIITPSKLRGVESFGMICSARELNLQAAPNVSGILVLDGNKYNVGKSFF